MKTKIQFLNRVLFVGMLVLLGLGVFAVLRIGQLNTAIASRARNVRATESLPFGPGWAADYGTTLYAAVDPNTGLPFGPGWAADYGTTISYPIRSAPGWAASYGTNSQVRPFGPGWAATYGVPAR